MEKKTATKTAQTQPYLEEHSSIPCDSTPRILAGFRLHKTATKRFCKSSNGTNLASPLTTVRGSTSPKSIFSTYNESASGCFDTSKIFPMRMSRRWGPSSTGSTTAFFWADAFVGAGYASLLSLLFQRERIRF